MALEMLLRFGDVVLVLKRQTQKVKLLRVMWREKWLSYKIHMIPEE